MMTQWTFIFIFLCRPSDFFLFSLRELEEAIQNAVTSITAEVLVLNNIKCRNILCIRIQQRRSSLVMLLPLNCIHLAMLCIEINTNNIY
jgi:hypothetical protein